MTLWIDDGSDEGVLANCANCVFAVEDPTRNMLSCGWNPPVATGEMTLEATASFPALTVAVWRQPQVDPDQHCHNHPMVRWWLVDAEAVTRQLVSDAEDPLAEDANLYRDSIRRPEDRPNLQSKEE